MENVDILVWGGIAAIFVSLVLAAAAGGIAGYIAGVRRVAGDPAQIEVLESGYDAAPDTVKAALQTVDKLADGIISLSRLMNLPPDIIDAIKETDDLLEEITDGIPAANKSADTNPQG